MSGFHEMHRRAIWILPALLALVLIAALAGSALDAAWAQGAAAPAQHQGGGEANLKIPDLSQVSFGGVAGRTLLQWGLLVCLLGLAFGMVIYKQLGGLPVHQSMREISESATSAMPKSMMRTSLSWVSMMFDGLMSRWITPRSCANSSTP